jgi:hypothetical protein
MLASARASNSLMPGASGAGAGCAAGLELRFDLARDDGAPLGAVLHQRHGHGDLHRAALLGRLALAHDIDDFSVGHDAQPVEFLVFARPQPQPLRQRRVETHRGHAFEVGERAARPKQPGPVGVVAADVLRAQQGQQAGAQLFELVRVEFLSDRLGISARNGVQKCRGALFLRAACTRGLRSRTRQRQQQGETEGFQGHGHSIRELCGGDHNRAGRRRINCENRLVTGHCLRDAVHGLLARKALVRPSPIN